MGNEASSPSQNQGTTEQGGLDSQQLQILHQQLAAQQQHLQHQREQIESMMSNCRTPNQQPQQSQQVQFPDRMAQATNYPIQNGEVHHRYQQQQQDRIQAADQSSQNYTPRVAPQMQHQQPSYRSEDRYQQLYSERQTTNPATSNRVSAENGSGVERSSDSGRRINPYQLLGISKNYTIQELQRAYKKKALEVHPDRGGSPEMFQLVTHCYQALTEHYQRKQADKTFYELRQESSDYQDKQEAQPMRNVDSEDLEGNNFNAQQFNQLYEKHRLSDDSDVGYAEWMKKTVPDSEDIPQSDQKFNLNNFNQTFQNSKAQDRKCDAVIQYKDPTPTSLHKQLSFSELGATPDTYTSGDSSAKLQYTDYKQAHTHSKLINPETVQQQPHQTVDQLEAQREGISYQMDDAEHQRYAHLRHEEKEQEITRQRQVTQKDKVAFDHYQQVNQLLLNQMKPEGGT